MFLQAWLSVAPGAPAALRVRLQARAALAPFDGKLAGVKAALVDLEPSVEHWLRHGLLAAAQLHPEQAARQMKLLQKAYKTLGWDPAGVYGHLHEHASGSSGVTKPGSSEQAFVLNEARLHELRNETAATDHLLAGIFVDDGEAALAAGTAEGGPKSLPEAAGASPMQAAPSSVEADPGLSELSTTADVPQAAFVAASQEEGLLWGLDATHSQLARAIAARESWPRDELKGLAKQMGRMLDGALERINDAALDATGMPLCEGDDPLEVNPDIHEFL